ncbi:General stress protein 69 [Blautia hydrogenotrophica]|uniref:aldo/keto reductase n=1 Tax=Blautia hydrogenotrophica TaxID=53443 RepID=UPI0006C50E1D|nr:aldo/keto reductase [Blautia hydrogenotrophica]CUN06875.1 General stress protein 69 [Blautia hydrogenotrophica]SCI04326.1 General stress protein 69 [uncultured Blautia sp.]
MDYRRLGNTTLEVSEIGMGCEGFVDKNEKQIAGLVDLMEREGVNYLDLYTPNPQVRSGLGKALRGRRERFLLQAHLCTIWKNGQYERTRNIQEVKAGFEDLLLCLETDHVEIGMVHYVDTMEDWQAVSEGVVMEYARDLRERGVIQCIGLSSHNPVVALEAVKSGLIQVLMFSVNPCYDLQPASENCEELWDEKNYQGQLLNMDADRQELYETCSRLGVGITVMKAFGGGDLLNEQLSPAGKSLTPCQCIHYALTRPAVATVLSGARTEQELQESLAYVTASEEDRDFAKAFAGFPRMSWKGHCMYCGHCAPCPKEIDVAAVTKFLNLSKAQGSVPETVREHYQLLAHKADECVECGACEKRCPFEVAVIENMRQAREVFGTGR